MRGANAARASLPAIWTPVPAGAACKLMPVGTSVTDGLYGNSTQDSRGGYRGPLYDSCKRANANVDFVGPQAGPTGTGTGHAGLPGITIAGMAAVLSGYLTTYTPHIVLVELGMNDTDLAARATSCGTAIVDLIFTTLPNALVLVQNVIPTYAPNLHPLYNAQLAIEVANRRAAGKHIELLDMNTQCGLVVGSRDYTESVPGLADWVHPSAVGYAKMVAPIYASLSKYWR